MTVNEYRRKHRRCRTCRYLNYLCEDLWECKAKQKDISTDPHKTRAGMFCRVYQPLEEAQES